MALKINRAPCIFSLDVPGQWSYVPVISKGNQARLRENRPMANQSNRAQIRQDGSEVVLTYADPMTGEQIVRRFYAPANGGYVRDQSGRQICQGLSHRGNTLVLTGGNSLISLIRREWQVARRAETRFLAA